MLALAEERVLGAGQDQREMLDQVRSRRRTDQRLFILGQGRIAVRQQCLGIQLDLACRRGETLGYAILLLSELAVACLERHPHPARLLAQRLERNAGWLELVAVSGSDVTIPEVATETKAARQVEDDLGIGTGLTTRLDHLRPQLHQRLRLGT